jgi:hypothetical protein
MDEKLNILTVAADEPAHRRRQIRRRRAQAARMRRECALESILTRDTRPRRQPPLRVVEDDAA